MARFTCDRPRRGAEEIATTLFTIGARRQLLPECLRNERNYRLQQSQRIVEGVHQHGARHLGIGSAGTDPRLDRFKIPVRQFIPDKTTCRIRVRIESHASRALSLGPATAGTGTHGPERRIGVGNRRVESIEDPTVSNRQRLRWNCMQRLHRFRTHFRKQETSDVPQLRQKIPSRREALLKIGGIEQHIHAQPHARDHRPSQCIGTVQLHHIQRIDAVAE